MFWAANRTEEKLQIKDFDSKPFVNFLLSISENEFQLFIFIYLPVHLVTSPTRTKPVVKQRRGGLASDARGIT